MTDHTVYTAPLGAAIPGEAGFDPRAWSPVGTADAGRGAKLEPIADDEAVIGWGRIDRTFTIEAPVRIRITPWALRQMFGIPEGFPLYYRPELPALDRGHTDRLLHGISRAVRENAPVVAHALTIALDLPPLERAELVNTIDQLQRTAAAAEWHLAANTGDGEYRDADQMIRDFAVQALGELLWNVSNSAPNSLTGPLWDGGGAAYTLDYLQAQRSAGWWWV